MQSGLLRVSLVLSFAVVVSAIIAGCSVKPAAQVSASELKLARQNHAALSTGSSKTQVLEAFRSGNMVKLGSSELGGVTVEEWKYEAFHDESQRKDLFVTFLYFCDDRFVDTSDSRIDFRNNPSLVEEWRHSLK